MDNQWRRLACKPLGSSEVPEKKGEVSHSNNDSNCKDHDALGLVMVGKCCTDFPQDILENILSKVPFPAVFKARVLSRSWYFKFPVSQSVRYLSPSLQNMITTVSHKWPTHCPVMISKEEILGFDRARYRWQPMMTISYLPVMTWSSLSIGGSLVCVVSDCDLGYNVYVTNVLTRSWKKLPARPFSEEPDHVRLLPVDSDSYKVLLVYRRSRDEEGVHTQIYDSRKRTWTVKMSLVTLDTFFVTSALLNGRLYCMCRDSAIDPLHVWTHDLADNSWTSIPHSFLSEDVVDGAVLRCGEKVMVVIWYHIDLDEVNAEAIEKICGLYTPKNSIGIYELDPESLILREVTKGPNHLTVGVGLRDRQAHFASDSEFLYFGQTLPSCPVLSYNVQNGTWGCIPAACYIFGGLDDKVWLESPFEPGINPFVMP